MTLKGKTYEITRNNLSAHELIGLKVKIVRSVDAKKTGIEGKIINETKNVLEVETKKGLKKIPKKEVFLEFELGNEKIVLDGKSIVEKPEKRTKEMWRKCHGKMH